MTREEIQKAIVAIPNNNILIQAGTGVGKTLAAISKIALIDPQKILIVIPRIVLIGNWNEEFIKWGQEKYLRRVEYVTYVSLPKMMDRTYDVIVFDEAHHITPRCQEAIPFIHSDYNILLSATIKRTLKPKLETLFTNLYTFEVSLKTAIDNDILPEPRIVLIPLSLKTTQATEILQYGTKSAKQYDSDYETWLKNKWLYLKTKPNYGVRVHCTQQQYYNEICDYIENCSKRLRNGLVPTKQIPIVEQARKRKGKERLSWLAEIKSDFVKTLLNQLGGYRTLTFCHNIEQSERLGTYSINSKNKHSKEYLQMFNKREINNLTCIDMLNEGINLSDCELLIFVVYNVSEIMQIQKQGRGLRHKKPIFIMPYYKNTKEEQIVKDMIADYDKSLVTVVTNPLSINEYLNR